MTKPIELKLRTIESVKAGKRIIEVAQEFGVSSRSIERWLKKYEKGGAEGLKKTKTHRRPWNALQEEIREKVYLLKERYPEITFSDAQKMLRNQGIHLSIGSIHKIWRRYGIVENKKAKGIKILPNALLFEDIKWAIEGAEKILKEKGIEAVAKILNRLPYCGGAEVLDRVPYELLSLRRQLEKLPFLFGKEPIDTLYKKVHTLRLSLEREKLFYSSLRAGIFELNVLFWAGRPKEMLSLVKILEKKMRCNFIFYFTINLLKGMALSRLLKIDEAIRCASICKRLTKNFSHPDFYIGLGNLYSNIGMYLSAKDCYEKATPNVSGDVRNQCLLALAGIYALLGEYRKALSTLNELEQKSVETRLPIYPLIPLIRAQVSFGLGQIVETADKVRIAIESAKKKEVIQYLHTSTMVLSALYYATGESKRALTLIKSFIPLLKRRKMMQDYYIRRLYVSKDEIFLPSRYRKEPFINLILLMKKANQTLRIKDYNKALKFAINRGLSGYFHRLCIFYPEIVIKVLEKGGLIGLPKAILRLPVFNREVSVYNIKFLGDLVVFKNQKYLKARLRPKDSAFLIYLSQRAMEPKKAINLDEVYKNFWPKSEKASRNFSHLLVRIKRALKIPAHLLTISRSYGEPELINEGIYFTTDLQEFEQTLAQAKALERTGEWGFARKEYLRAFQLFRGEPFKKNFDNWSLDMRFKILNQLETEAVNFAKSCLERNNKRDARKVLEKVLKIIPESEEIRKVLNSSMVG